MIAIINNKEYKDINYISVNTDKCGVLQLTKGHTSFLGSGILTKINMVDNEIIFNLNGVFYFENDYFIFVSI